MEEREKREKREKRKKRRERKRKETSAKEKHFLVMISNENFRVGCSQEWSKSPLAMIFIVLSSF